MKGEAHAHCIGTGRAAMFTFAHHSLVQYDTEKSAVIFSRPSTRPTALLVRLNVEDARRLHRMARAYPTPRSASAAVFESTDDAACAAGAPSATTTL
jgi:hypothetical protein